MQWLDAADTAQALDRNAVVAALDDMLRARVAAEVDCPPRTVMPLPAGGLFLSMLARDREHAIAKLLTVHPDNAEHGLPRLQARAILYQAATGVPLLALDGNVLTARRTAALSVCAVRRLAPAGLHRLLIVGSGAQAQAHAEAFLAAGACRSVLIGARRPEAARELAERLLCDGLAGNVPIEAVDQIEPAAWEADVIVTATGAMRPVLPDVAKAGAVICAIGSFTPGMAELPPALVQRSRVVVDDLAACRLEAGDLILAEVAWDAVEELGRERRAVETTRPTIFKSVGCALWDLAAATCAHRTMAGPS